jgi:hypothetical protein
MGSSSRRKSRDSTSSERLNVKRKEVLRILERAVCVKELKDMLEDFPDGAKVLFACDYGDHSHTEQALTVVEVELIDPSCQTIVKSAYSQSGMALRDVEDEEVPGDSHKLPPIVILK